jgi:gamma-glutamyltranspeptidase/glutathione hydrolase
VKLFSILAFFIMTFSCAAAEERVQGRSMVITRYGIAATEQPLASQAAIAILEQGGNAMDAAVAANAVLGLVAPMMCGIGGDMFAIVYEAKTGKLYGLNASGWAPSGLSPQFLRGLGMTNMPQNGIHSVTIPGAVSGWEHMLKRFGKKSFKTVLAPAIRYATEGFPVTELDAAAWNSSLIKKEENAMRTYMPNGHSPKVGEIFRNPELAWCYKQIAARGAKAYYDGPITDRLLAFSKKKGGTWVRQDFSQFSAKWVDPISTTYHGWRVYEIPPNGQGIAALAMLNIMEQFPLREYGVNSAKALHLMIEAKKLAYADMLRYVADPNFAKVPVEGMLSKAHPAARAKLINPDQANCNVEASRSFETGNDTTYLCVEDKDGNMVSYIQSNYAGFGSGLVPDGLGFALQNRGGLFSLDPAHPNVLAGHKRPLHTIIPAFMEKDDVKIAFGIMGGFNQSQAHAQFVSKVVDFEMNIQAALDSPRFTKLTFTGCDVEIESRVPVEIREALQSKGHQVKVIAPFSQNVGGGQAVMRDFHSGVNYGGSDPRKDGAAIPQPVGH